MKLGLRTRGTRAEREGSGPHLHCWPHSGRHTGTETEDREASRGSPETRQHKFPLAKKPIKPLTRRRRSGNGAAMAANSNSRLLLFRLSAASRGVRHKGSVVLSAGLLGERINLFHSALRLHAAQREHSATSKRCLSKDARSCSYRASASLSCSF